MYLSRNRVDYEAYQGDCVKWHVTNVTCIRHYALACHRDEFVMYLSRICHVYIMHMSQTSHWLGSIPGISLSLSVSLCLSTYLYTYIHTYICVCIYIYINATKYILETSNFIYNFHLIYAVHIYLTTVSVSISLLVSIYLWQLLNPSLYIYSLSLGLDLDFSVHEKGRFPIM